MFVIYCIVTQMRLLCNLQYQMIGTSPACTLINIILPRVIKKNLNNNNNTKFVKRRVAVASEALANRTVKKHRRRRTNVL